MRSRHLWLACVCVCVLGVLSSAQVLAQDVPPYLTQQGRLVDALNQPVSGVEDVTFTLYDGPDPGAAVLWTETKAVNFANGFYSVVLGQQVALPLDSFDGSTRYLGVTVVSEGVEMMPRFAIHSVPYAIKSGVAQNVTGDITPTTITVGGANGTVIDASGISIGGNVIIDASGEWSGPAPVVSFNDLLDRPFTLNDLNCSDGEVPQVVGGAWTCTPASAADTLSGLGCAEGEIPAFVGGAWTCAADADTNTTYTAGTGISISGASNVIDVDTAAVQARVGGSCASGLSIRQINVDGTVICEADDDTNTTYSAGAGLTQTGTVFSVDGAQTQARVSGSCAAGQSIRAIAADGTVTCEVDDDTDTNTTYTAGPGLRLTGTAFELQASEQFLRNAQLSGADATLSGMVLSGGRLVLGQGGYGAGATDLVVNAANSPYGARSKKGG